MKADIITNSENMVTFPFLTTYVADNITPYYYLKTENDAALVLKADISSIYTQSEIN